MKVQLDALFRRRVYPHGRLQLHNGVRLHDHLVIIPVEGHFALDFYPTCREKCRSESALPTCVLHELVDAHGVLV